MSRSVPTVIVEQRVLLREGLASLLHDSLFKVVASVATVDELPQPPPARPALLIIGFAKGAPGDPQLLEKIHSARQNYTVVAVAEGGSQLAQLDVLRILRSDADGYILNVPSRDVLLKCLELAVLGQKLVVLGEGETVEIPKIDVRPTVTEDACPRQNGNGSARSALSERETEILRCLAGGDSNKVIARDCNIAESTVKIHLKSILRKIHVQNRTQAAIWAIQNNLVRSCVSPSVAPTELTQDLPDLAAPQEVAKAELA